MINKPRGLRSEGEQVATIAVSGYYGFGNLGDEAVLAGIVQSFKDKCPKAELVILSADPAATQELHAVRAVHRMNPGEVIGILREADLLISGGGSLLQDVTSVRSLAYYLGVIWLAKKLGKMTMVYAQGVGPLARSISRRMARSVLSRVDLITVRDEPSRECLDQLGVDGPRVVVTADPSFALQPAAAEDAEELLRAVGAPEDVPLVGVSVRPWRDQLEWLPTLARGLDMAASRVGAALVFLPMQRDQDLGMSVQIASGMASRSVVVSVPLRAAQALALAGKMSYMVGMRLHALIFAASAGVPFLGISYDPKVDAFARSVGQDPPVRFDDIDSAQIAERIVGDWERRQNLAGRLVGLVQGLRAAADANADLACGLVSDR